MPPLLIILVLNFSLYSVYAHLDAYLEMEGCEMSIVGAALSLLALGVGGGKLLYGTVSDRFGMRVTVFMAAVFHGAALSLLLFGGSPVAMIAGCVVLGFV
jgi:predicted MFS family arabinose efflux permease